MVNSPLVFASYLFLYCTKTDEIMTQATIFTFPPFVTKAQLVQNYGVSADQLKTCLGDQLAQQINWSRTRTFFPDQSDLIYSRLSPVIYPKVIEARTKMIIEASIKSIKVA